MRSKTWTIFSGELNWRRDPNRQRREAPVPTKVDTQGKPVGTTTSIGFRSELASGVFGLKKCRQLTAVLTSRGEELSFKR